MVTTHRAVVVLRVFLVLMFGALVVFQVMSIPGQFRDTGHVRWPMTALSVFWVLCVQVVIVAIWKLLTLVEKDRIFSEASMKWVDAIVWAIAAAWVVFQCFFLYVGFNADDPSVVILLFLVSIGITVVGLLMVVMRALLRQATTLRTDMEQVI